MNRKILSQEALKLIACVTMLLDHIGATIFPSAVLRIIGRISFPIFCFLLAEGIAHTRNPKKYALRLLIGALLAEIPFDLLFYGSVSFVHQNVMITLLLGFLMVIWARKTGNMMVPFAVCYLAAVFLRTDYSGFGIGLIGLFFITREHPRKFLIQLIGVAILMWIMGGMEISLGVIRLPIQLFGVLAMVPIFLYSGVKSTRNVWIRRGFYLFYPVHLVILLILQKM